MRVAVFSGLASDIGGGGSGCDCGSCSTAVVAAAVAVATGCGCKPHDQPTPRNGPSAGGAKRSEEERCRQRQARGGVIGSLRHVPIWVSSYSDFSDC